MTNDNPNLIPPPSIGESVPSSAVSSPTPLPKARGSKLWILVALCLVVGVGLGVFVYQQSIAPAPKPSSKPVASPAAKPTPVVSPSPEVGNINQVTPQSLNVVFPKTGEVRVYFATYDSANPVILNQLIRLTGTNKSADLLIPGSLPSGNKMAIVNSGLSVAAGETLKIQVYDNGNESRPGVGWIKPDASNKCGSTTKSNAAPLVEWATAQAAGQPLVSVQCWGDWGAASDTDYNDYLVIVSYNPSATTAASPIPSPSPSAFISVSPIPSPSPSAVVVRSPSPSPAAEDESDTTVLASPSARVTMPEGSALPDAGIFEVTAGTMGMGIVFILLGVFGLLLI